jgi:hypothetical protein
MAKATIRVSLPYRLCSYTITASYAGGELYEPSTASTVVEVKAPPSLPLSAVPEVLWYVVVTVGIVIAAIKAPRSSRRP